MTSLLSNSSGLNVRNKKLNGGAEVVIGPSLNIWDVKNNPRPEVVATAADALAGESAVGNQSIYKYMNYGSPLDEFPLPFSYGQTLAITPKTGGKRKVKRNVYK